MQRWLCEGERCGFGIIGNLRLVKRGRAYADSSDDAKEAVDHQVVRQEKRITTSPKEQVMIV